MEPTRQPAAQDEHNIGKSLNTARTYTYRHAWSHMDIFDRLKDEKYLSATIEELFGNIVTSDDPKGQQKKPPHLNPAVNNNLEDCNYTAPPKLAPSP